MQKKMISLVAMMIIAVAFLTIVGGIFGDMEVSSGDAFVMLYIGLTLFICIVVALSVLSGITKKDRNKDMPNRPKSPPSYRPNAQDHNHITLASVGHDKAHELQQLDTMLEAGLITKEEYQERLRRLRNQTPNGPM